MLSFENYIGTESMNTTFAEKFSTLAPWFDKIIYSIRKECKQEHLKIDPIFVRKNFQGKPLAQITSDEIRAVYADQIMQGHETLGEFVTNRWIFKNLDLYRYFERKLLAIRPDFDAITELTDAQAQDIIEDGLKHFSLDDLFIFITLNSVALPKDKLQNLGDRALDHLSKSKKEEEMAQENSAKEGLQQIIARLTVRFEDKMDEQKKRYEFEIKKLTSEVQKLKNQLKETTCQAR